MSKYTDIMVYTETKQKLRKFADSKNISLAELLEEIANRITRPNFPFNPDQVKKEIENDK